MSHEQNAILDDPQLPEEVITEPQPKRRGPYKPRSPGQKPETFAGYVAALPQPFRPRHLTEAIRLYASDNGLTTEEFVKVDPARFLRQHGLPNPLKRFRVIANRGGQQSDPREYDAVDESEACRRYRAECLTGKDSDKWNCHCFLLDY